MWAFFKFYIGGRNSSAVTAVVNDDYNEIELKA